MINSAAVYQAISNPAAAWLYWHVTYWHEKPGGTEFRGKHWVFGNYESWERKTGMSYRQLHRNFGWLRTEGWIETAKKEMPKAGLVMLVRPIKRPPSVSVNGQTVCPQTVTPSDPLGPDHITENPTEIPSIETAATAPAGPSPCLPPELEEEGGEEDQSMKLPKAPHSVHDVAGLVAAKNKLHQPTASQSLAKTWQIGMKAHLPNGLVIVGVKDQAMLKQFAKHCEPGTAEAILAHVMAEWIAFTKQCEQEAGAFKTPASPTLGFLVKFAQQAVAFYLHQTSKTATAKVVVKPNPVSAQLIAGHEPAQPAVTLDDLLAPIDPADALKD